MLLLLAACNNADTKNKYNPEKEVGAESKEQDSIAVYTFPVHEGFGYAIFIHDKEFIHQDCIPAIAGIKPFATTEQARNTGELVAAKIRNGQLPTLTIDELAKLGVTQQ